MRNDCGKKQREKEKEHAGDRTGHYEQEQMEDGKENGQKDKKVEWMRAAGEG